jgi:2-polyprenyl-3-methyl-5-hydroxy-6-metoxy-1,4-benzoquinol methylase
MSSEPELHPEAVAVRERYARRTANELYSALRPEVVRSTQEWQRELLRVLAAHCRHSGADLQQLRLLDVGCGFGGHLLDFLRIVARACSRSAPKASLGGAGAPG